MDFTDQFKSIWLVILPIMEFWCPKYEIGKDVSKYFYLALVLSMRNPLQFVFSCKFSVFCIFLHEFFYFWYFI